MSKRTVYTVGRTYSFAMAGGSSEPAIYRGVNRQGMHRFELPGGQLWTGHAAPVTPDRKTNLPISSARS